MPAAKGKPRRAPRRWWELDDERLLELAPRDLGLDIAGTALEARLEQLHGELAAAGLVFRPYVWLSIDWFTPDGLTGFAAPFFLAHPRLLQLERRQMLEVEGGGHAECLAILRHEAAHALDNAYRLRRRAEFRRVFGASSAPYRQTYRANPQSRRFVLNLPGWYAQSHPLEDFAETFAVWLQPGSRWRKRYAGWPALAKLECVDRLMAEIGPRRPPVRTRAREHPLSEAKEPLAALYRAKKRRFATGTSAVHDDVLRRVFTDQPRRRRATAAGYLTRRRTALVRRISEFTGQHRYTVDQVLAQTIAACREQGLVLARSERETDLDAVSLLTARTMRFVSGRPLLSR